jgi:putative heme transporter
VHTRPDRAHDGAAVAEPPPLELTAEDLARLNATFRPPRWLRYLGSSSWLAVGVLLVVVGLVWLLGETATIANPLVCGLIVAAVTSPLVAKLAPHITRTGAAAVVLLLAVAIAGGVAFLVIRGITSQNGSIGNLASSAVDKLRGWLEDAGVSTSGADGVSSSLKAAAPNVISTLTHGVFAGIKGIASLAFGLSLAALSTFFLLRDGPVMRTWLESHSGVPRPVAHTITRGMLTALRHYFGGVTIVALFNAVVVGLGAWLLDVPLPGTIAIVTLVTAYIPYLGAFVAGAFAVTLALGAKGATVALIMLVIVILANGLLQNIVQPFAMGAALNLNPLVVLVLTIAAGCIFGTIGLVLAGPIASATVHIVRELSRARATAPT